MDFKYYVDTDFIPYQSYFKEYKIIFQLLKINTNYKLVLYENDIVLKSWIIKFPQDRDRIIEIVYKNHKSLTESRFKLWLEMYER